MYGVDRNDTAAGHRLERLDDDVAGRRERDRSVERDRRSVVVRARPRRPQCDRPLLLDRGPSRDEHVASPVLRYLHRQQRRRPEPVEPETAAGQHPRDLQGPIPDDAAAQQRRRFHVGERRRGAHGEVCSHGNLLGVATVGIPSGEHGIGTEILLPRSTVRARSARTGQPCHAGSITDRPFGDAISYARDPAHRLMPGDDRQGPRGEVSLHDLQIGATHAAR